MLLNFSFFEKNKKYRYSFLTVILLLCNLNLLAFQSSPDSLLSKEYAYLKTKVFQNIKDSSKASIYSQSYLHKAKMKNDTIKIVNGYYYTAAVFKDINVVEKYADSMILFSKNLKTKYYPALGYLTKARVEYNKGHFKKAFDLYLKTNESAKESGNDNYYYASKKGIGILKSRIGEYKTALKELKECHMYYAKSKEKTPKKYLSILFALSDAYNLNKKLDSATSVNILGHKECGIYGKNDFKYYFTLNEGINLYDKKNYTTARDSLSIAIEEFKINKDKANLSMAYFYLGKTLNALGKEKEAIKAHIIVDDIFQEISEIMPNNRENYEILINYYKKLGDKDNQLRYISRLITVDSVLHTNYRYLIKNVVQNYDTPKLLSEKQDIIHSLERKEQTSKALIVGLIIISFLLLFLWLYNRHKQKIYKRRFEEIYYKRNTNSKNKKQAIISIEKSKIAIPEESIKEILSNLTLFEKELGFLESDLSIHILAKKFETNYKYLSKVINTYKKKSFNHYVNDLRIEQSIIKLKTDPKFRKYTIKAIANEIGFNTTDSFSKAFYKLNGIRPSYFIKELERQIAIRKDPK